jgi:hypothetical protein
MEFSMCGEPYIRHDSEGAYVDMNEFRAYRDEKEVDWRFVLGFFRLIIWAIIFGIGFWCGRYSMMN